MSDINPAAEKVSNVIEGNECWFCKDCGAEWSFAMGDNEVPEICPYCIEDNERSINANASIRNVIVIFTQGNEHIHSWETTYDNLSLDTMLESAGCNGLIDESIPLQFEVFHEDDVSGSGEPIINGTLNSSLLNS